MNLIRAERKGVDGWAESRHAFDVMDVVRSPCCCGNGDGGDAGEEVSPDAVTR